MPVVCNTSHPQRTPFQDLGAPFPNQFPANVPGKAAGVPIPIIEGVSGFLFGSGSVKSEE